MVFKTRISRLFLCMDILKQTVNIQLWAGKDLKFMPYIALEAVLEAKRMGGGTPFVPCRSAPASERN